MAGAQGDEFDGRIAIHKLANSIEVSSIQGCVILVSTLNPSAATACHRHSPLDNKPLGTCFPGDNAGSVSERIASAIYETLLEPSDFVVELLSGGSSTVYAPMASVNFQPDNKTLQQTTEQVMIAFGAPFSTRLTQLPNDSIASCLNEAETPFVRVYLGGGASACANLIEAAWTGCRNTLVHLGVLNEEFVLRSTRMLEVSSDDNYVMSPTAGLLELCRDIGDDVHKGSPIARVFNPAETGGKPLILKANRNGVLMARHHHGMVSQGDCIAVVADEVQR